MSYFIFRKFLLSSRLRGTIFFLTVLSAGLDMANGQSSQVSGQVVDPEKAVISGVLLNLTRVKTGEQRRTTSTSEGYFSFPLLHSGHYALAAEKSGFDSQQQTGIVVETGSITAVDVTLKVGQVAQTVSVEATIPLPGLRHPIANSAFALHLSY